MLHKRIRINTRNSDPLLLDAEDHSEPADMRDEYAFSEGMRGTSSSEDEKSAHVVNPNQETPPPHVLIQSNNPYEARFPGRRVISREALHIAKLLRADGYSVIIEPNSEKKLNYVTEKGLREFLADPIHMVIVGIPLSVVVNIISTWLYDRFKRTPSTEEFSLVIETDENELCVRYNHKGEPISEKRFQAILKLAERSALRYAASQRIIPPDPTRPVPIFLEPY